MNKASITRTKRTASTRVKETETSSHQNTHPRPRNTQSGEISKAQDFFLRNEGNQAPQPLDPTQKRGDP